MYLQTNGRAVSGYTRAVSSATVTAAVASRAAIVIVVAAFRAEPVARPEQLGWERDECFDPMTRLVAVEAFVSASEAEAAACDALPVSRSDFAVLEFDIGIETAPTFAGCLVVAYVALLTKGGAKPELGSGRPVKTQSMCRTLTCGLHLCC